jgi:hypothetical protein
MIANDEDDAVPWQQGIEFFLALRRLDKEVYMFSYNGEKHGLRSASTRKTTRDVCRSSSITSERCARARMDGERILICNAKRRRRKYRATEEGDEP